MKEAKEILKEVLEYTGETKNGLAKKIGLPRSQNLYDIEKGKVKNISSELSEKIVSKYPGISRDYLLTGEGEMKLNRVEKNEAKETSEIIELNALTTVMARHIARIEAKLYNKDINQCLDEFDEDVLFETRRLINKKS